MTDAPNTIEEQLKELGRQFNHAQNIISGLLDQAAHQRRHITELEVKLAARDERIRLLEDGQCRCAETSKCGLESILDA